jgi:hypothetical protein
MSSDNALPLILACSVGSLFVAWVLARWVLRRDTGTAAMQAPRHSFGGRTARSDSWPCSWPR